MSITWTYYGTSGLTRLHGSRTPGFKESSQKSQEKIGTKSVRSLDIAGHIGVRHERDAFFRGYQPDGSIYTTDLPEINA